MNTEKSDWGEADGYADYECPECGRTTEGFAWGDYAPGGTCYGCGTPLDLVSIRPLGKDK